MIKPVDFEVSFPVAGYVKGRYAGCPEVGVPEEIRECELNHGSYYETEAGPDVNIE